MSTKPPAPLTIPVTPAFLQYARTMEAQGVRVDLISAPFVAAGTLQVARIGDRYRVLIPPGADYPKVTAPQLAVAAYRYGRRPVITIEDEADALRVLILRARERARGDCPFCGFDPCVDTCAVRAIKAGRWIAR